MPFCLFRFYRQWKQLSLLTGFMFLLVSLTLGPFETDQFAFAETLSKQGWYRLRTNSVPFQPQDVIPDSTGGIWITAIDGTEYDPCVWNRPAGTSDNAFHYITNDRRNNYLNPEYLTPIEKPRLDVSILYAVKDLQNNTWYSLKNRKVLCEKDDGTWLTFSMQDTTDISMGADSTNVDSAHRIRLINHADGTQDKLLISARGMIRVDADLNAAETRVNYTSYNNDFIYDALIDSQGRYWVATGRGVEKGTNMINTANVLNLFPDNPSVPGASSITEIPMTCIEEDKQGNIWFGSSDYNADGVYCYTADGTWIKYDPYALLSIGRKVTSIAGADDGTVWFSFLYSGLVRFTPDENEGQWEHFSGASLGIESESFLSVDLNGSTVWFVSGYNPSVSGNGTGVHFMTVDEQGQFQAPVHYTFRESSTTLSGNRHSYIAADKSGGVWFPAYDASAVARLKADGSWEQFRPEGLEAYGFPGIAADSTNTVYFAPLNNPPLAYNVSTEQWVDLPALPYTDFYYYGIHIDPNDGKWFHGAFGVYYLNPDNTAWTRYSTEEVPEMSDNYIEHVQVDDDGNAWIMGRYGVTLKKNNPAQGAPEWVKFTSGDASGYNGGYRVYVDDDGGVWNAAKQRYNPENDTWLTVTDTSALEHRHLRFLNGNVPADMDLTDAPEPVNGLDPERMTVDSRGTVYICGGLGTVNAGIVAYSPQKGDIDGNAKVELTDALVALKTLTGSDTSPITSGGEVNEDGKIGIAEIIYILQDVAEIR